MPEYGCFPSCEEFGPADLVEQARMAEQAGFQSLWISDHYHGSGSARVRSSTSTSSGTSGHPRASAWRCEHVACLSAFADAGFDRVYVNQTGPDQRGVFDFYRTKVLPPAADGTPARDSATMVIAEGSPK